MTRGVICSAGDKMSGARESARYDRTKGTTKAPRTASAVTSAGYNMGFNSARCLALAGSDLGAQRHGHWHSGTALGSLALGSRELWSRNIGHGTLVTEHWSRNVGH